MPGLARCEAKGQNQIRNKIALQGFDDLLRMMLHEGSPAMIEQVIKPVSQDGDLIMAELNALTTQLTNLIDDQAQATTRVVRDLYRTKISAIETQITVLNQRLDDLNLSTEPRQMIEDRHLAFAEIQRIGLESFWGLSSTQINHLLHRLFGNVRIAVRDKQLVGLTDQPRNRRRPRK
jgi:hypothetical protein